MDAASINQSEIPCKTESSAEAPPQGFVANVGLTEHVAVELDPPSQPDPEVLFTATQVRAIAFQAAGAATGVAMRLHPDWVFPSNEVALGVEAVLVAFQVPGGGPA